MLSHSEEITIFSNRCWESDSITLSLSVIEKVSFIKWFAISVVAIHYNLGQFLTKGKIWCAIRLLCALMDNIGANILSCTNSNQWVIIHTHLSGFLIGKYDNPFMRIFVLVVRTIVIVFNLRITALEFTQIQWCSIIILIISVPILNIITCILIKVVIIHKIWVQYEYLFRSYYRI